MVVKAFWVYPFAFVLGDLSTPLNLAVLSEEPLVTELVFRVPAHFLWAGRPLSGERE